MRIKEYDIDLDNADIDNIAASQSPAGTALNLNGAVGTGNLDYARALSVTSGGDDTGITFDVVGVDANGDSQTESITGANADVALGTKYFKSVTSITPSDSVATTVTVGTGNVTRIMATQTIPLEPYDEIATVASVDVTGTISYTIQETFDNVLELTEADILWVAVSAHTTKTADTTAAVSRGARAIRLIVNSYTDTAELQMTVIPTHHGH